jgi:ParB-like chromosome segregation protein Spo0J
MAKRQADDGQTTTIDALTADPANPRRRTARGRELLVRSLKDHGAARSIVVDEHGGILAGNGVVDAARSAGITRVRIIDAGGDELIAVRRTGLTDLQKRELTIADNRTGELAEWNADALGAAKDAGLDLRPFWTPEEEAALISNAAADAVVGIAQEDTGDGEHAAAATTGDFQTFSCPLTVEQERIVRSALRVARRVYSVTTAGDALAAALAAWSKAQQEPT